MLIQRAEHNLLLHRVTRVAGAVPVTAAAAARVQTMIVLTAAQRSGVCLVLSAKMPVKSTSEVNACFAHDQLCCLALWCAAAEVEPCKEMWSSFGQSYVKHCYPFELAFLSAKEV